MNITRIGIDLAKQVFQIHGVDSVGKVVIKKQLKRHQMLTYFAKLTPVLIGMEACGGAHYWAFNCALYYYLSLSLASTTSLRQYCSSYKQNSKT